MRKLIVLTAALLTFASTAFAEIGSLSSDLVFTPVTPCRIMDTRNAGSKSGILAAGSTRGFYSWASYYTDQGGTNTSCNVLFGVNQAGIVVNFTVVSPETAGYITVYPADLVTRPTASTVNFTAGAVVGNNATLKVAQVASGDGFKIWTTTNVHVVGDIVGYYSKPVATALECVDTTAVTSPISSGPAGSQYYGFASASACATGYTQTSLRCQVNDARASGTDVGGGTCAGNAPVNTLSLSAVRTCCRIPGR